ncbi:hypothetical protein AAHC03_01848 [Spirometra sp. Aus1]
MRPKAVKNNTGKTGKESALDIKLRGTKARNGFRVASRNHSNNNNKHSAVPGKLAKPAIDHKHKKQPEIWFTGVPSALVKASQDSQESTAPDLVKAKSFTGPTKRIAMDCEFVGVGFDGKDSALARVSIVNQFGHLLMDEYVRPKEKITDYRTAVSGITPSHMRPGGPAKDFDSVHQKVAELCKGRILVGHAVHHDLKVLMLSHPRRDIRDTAYYKPFKALFNDRVPSLKALTERVLGVKVQHAEHDSVEDARATMRLYTSVKRIWEAQIKAINAGKSPKDVKKLAAHLRIPSAPSEVDVEQIKPTSLAKIAFDVTSEFYSGISADASGSRDSRGLTSYGNPDRPTPAVLQGRPRVDGRGRKCSKNRARFLEKRKKLRKNKAFAPSSSFLS